MISAHHFPALSGFRTWCTRHRVAAGAALALALMFGQSDAARSAYAGEYEALRHRPGLWLANMSVIGSGREVAEICLGGKADRLSWVRASVQDCDRYDIFTAPDRIVIQSVCRINDKTVASTTVISGNLQTGYAAEMLIGRLAARGAAPDSVFTGRSATLRVEAEWRGACPAGQRPGDVTALADVPPITEVLMDRGKR